MGNRRWRPCRLGIVKRDHVAAPQHRSGAGRSERRCLLHVPTGKRCRPGHRPPRSAWAKLGLSEHSETVIQNLHGGSVAITREGYVAIGGLDEDFVGWGGEDVDFWERAETLRATRFGYLPVVHLWHAPQTEKLQNGGAPAIKRYYELADMPPEERIARLKARPARRK